MFLIPEGKSAREGAYLDYPFDEMLAVLKLESHRNQCMVIGEDLGTFPPSYKTKAAEAGLLSYKVFYFEREKDSTFKPPQRYEPLALATLSTHDLPTFAGWQIGADIDERERLDLYPTKDLLGNDRAGRERDQRLIKEAFETQGLDVNAKTVSMESAQLYLAHTPCAIIMMQLEDILGVVAQVNVPATTHERPNWLHKLPHGLSDIAADEKFSALAKQVTAERRKTLIDYPRSTYRLQFHKEFTFYDAAKIIPYLAKLGISHVYASPYLQARPGSQHGYDITDHNKLNPELGGEEGYRVYCEALNQRGLKQILDFVPNHMGVGGSDNIWWLNVLEWGEASPYARYFDIDWRPRYTGTMPRLLAPFLGDHYGDVLNRGELKLVFDAEIGSFNVWYFSHCFPICPRDYSFIYPGSSEVATYSDGERCKRDLAHGRQHHSNIEQKVNEINQDKHKLHALLERQNYRLAYWRVAASDINYRRFFDINDLAGARPEDPELFDVMHRLVLSLVHQGTVTGLRIDHVDGLADPANYCQKLKQQAGSNLYLTVEKILCAGERLTAEWNISGTSGYDALNLISNIFIDPQGLQAIDSAYRRFTREGQSYDDIAYQSKILILETTLASELQALAIRLKRIAERDRYARDYPLDTLRQALKEIIGRFTVYRTYITRTHVGENDIVQIKQAVANAKRHSWIADISVYDFIGRLLLMEDEPSSPEIFDFVRKCQQLTGPVMAKGVEDTTFYRFNRLVSMNEVGANPRQMGLTIQDFHKENGRRVQDWPHAMLATATHDTKRGEDMRMRLHVLSELPEEWEKFLQDVSPFGAALKDASAGAIAPSNNDEYFIYQTLLGSWPNELLDSCPQDALENYIMRVADYLTKAMREAKLNTNWNNPDEYYENGTLKFLKQILTPSQNNIFLKNFLPFAGRLAYTGMIKSLAQVTLKLSLPGVPDIYQGTERWDYSLVDPDNRRAVDYAERAELAEQKEQPLAYYFTRWQNGEVKQKLTHIMLKHRAANPDFYSFGRYEPVVIKGEPPNKVLAYKRQFKGQNLVVAVPLFPAAWMNDGKWDSSQANSLSLDLAGVSYKNLLTQEKHKPNQTLADCFKTVPLAILVG